MVFLDNTTKDLTIASQSVLKKGAYRNSYITINSQGFPNGIKINLVDENKNQLYSLYDTNGNKVLSECYAEIGEFDVIQLPSKWNATTEEYEDFPEGTYHWFLKTEETEYLDSLELPITVTIADFKIFEVLTPEVTEDQDIQVKIRNYDNTIPSNADHLAYGNNYSYDSTNGIITYSYSDLNMTLGHHIQNIGGEYALEYEVISHNYALSLSSNKNILSYMNSDSVTLTATVTDNGIPVENKTVSFEIDPANYVKSAITNQNGQCSVTYSSRAAGDITCTAKINNTSSSPITIEDCIYYSTSEKECTNTNNYIIIVDLSSITLPSAFELSMDYKTNYEGRCGLFNKSTFTGNPNYSVFIGSPSTSGSSWYYGYRDTSTNTSDIYISATDYYTYTITRNGNSFNYKRGAVGDYSKSVTWFDSYNYVIGMMIWGGGKFSYVKNVKLKGLLENKITLTGSKSVISCNDNTDISTLKATLTNNIASVSGQTVCFFEEDPIKVVNNTNSYTNKNISLGDSFGVKYIAENSLDNFIYIGSGSNTIRYMSDGKIYVNNTYVLDATNVLKLKDGILYGDNNQSYDISSWVQNFTLEEMFGHGTAYLNVIDSGVTNNKGQVSISYHDENVGEHNVVAKTIVNDVLYSSDPVSISVQDYENEEEVIDIPIKIIWDDNNNADGNRPSSVTVTLYEDGVSIDSVEINSAMEWQYTFANKPKYNEHGTEIWWSVRSVPWSLYYLESLDQFNITFVYSPEVTDIIATVLWNDDNNFYNARPNSINIRLMRNNTSYQTITLSNENNWTTTISDLPTVINQQLVTYTLNAPDNIMSDPLYTYTLLTTEQNGNTYLFTYNLERSDTPIKPIK